MKLGLLTAALPDLSLEACADWAAASGFGMIEIACCPAGARAARRYAGVSHIDVAGLTDSEAQAITAMLAARGLAISSLAYYPNNLHPDSAHREQVNDHLRKVIVAAHKLGVGIVGTFVGRDQRKIVPENFVAFREAWPPWVKYAADHNVKIAIENCPMIFSYDEWPGGANLAYSPAIWREMFAIIPDENFGLTLDPS